MYVCVVLNFLVSVLESLLSEASAHFIQMSVIFRIRKTLKLVPKLNLIKKSRITFTFFRWVSLLLCLIFHFYVFGKQHTGLVFINLHSECLLQLLIYLRLIVFNTKRVLVAAYLLGSVEFTFRYVLLTKFKEKDGW